MTEQGQNLMLHRCCKSYVWNVRRFTDSRF